MEPYWGEINTTVSNWYGFNLNLILFLFVIFLAPFIYLLVLTIKTLKGITKNNEFNPSKFHKIFPFILILLFNILVMILLNELGGYSRLVPQFIEFYSIPLYLVLHIILILFLYPLVRELPHIESFFSHKMINAQTKSILIITSILGVYVLAFISPFLFIPANVYSRELPPKPDIIAHRGAAYLGPENTLHTAEIALQFGIVGWEVDIQISKDGIPFLMHDDTLTRTTNVEEVFPNRKNMAAETFTMAELKRLDAGSWFVDNDPFGVIKKGIITPEQAELYRGEEIPTFQEVLEFTKKHNIYLDFDLKGSSGDHPFHNVYFQIILEMTIQSGIDLNKIMIPSKNEGYMNLIIYKNANEVLTGYEYINTGDGYSNNEYRSFYLEGFPVMVYTIDSVERFCELWCLGVTWIKTNAPHKFSSLENPIIYIRSDFYTLIWIFSSLVAISSLIVLRFKIKKK